MHPESSLSLAGDVMIGRLVDEVIADRGPEYVWGDMLPTLRDASPLMVNLECALTDRTKTGLDGGFKPFHFRSSPANVAVLQTAGVGLVTVANNHICDFGREGLLDTLRALDSAGIAHVGAGRDASEAARPAVVEHAGMRFAIVGAADYPREWAAGPDSPGVNFVRVSSWREDRAAVREQIAAARALGEVVVFSIHWGPNMRTEPTPEFVDFAHAVIDAGAHVFWGHSAHVVQGIEFVDGGVILYDTGDFVDDYAVDPLLRNDISAVFKVTLRNDPPARVELAPVLISDMQVNHAPAPEGLFLADALRRRCAEMGARIESGEGGHLIATPMAPAIWKPT